VPAEERLGADEEGRPAPPRQDLRKRGQQRSIGELKFRPSDLATKHRELVAQDEDLDLLGLLPSQEEHGELQDATQRPVEEGDEQKLGALGCHGTAPYARAPQRPQAPMIEFSAPTGSDQSLRQTQNGSVPARC
jgi:hypothetical protein